MSQENRMVYSTMNANLLKCQLFQYVEVKVKLSVCLTKHYAMKEYRGGMDI
jgi:hypothetical protein